MKRSAYVVLAVSLAGSSALRAQSTTPQQPAVRKAQQPATAGKGTTLDPRDSVTIADVQKAAEELAVAVQAVVKKVTENPELKVAALNLAASAVTAAQLVVDQQAATLQATLEALAKQVAAASAQQSKSKH